MKVINILENGFQELYLFGVDNSFNGVLAVYSPDGELISKYEFSDHIGIREFIDALDKVAYCMFARDETSLKNYFGHFLKIDLYRNRRINFTSGLSPVNLNLAYLKSKNHNYLFGMNDDLKYGIMAIANEGKILTKHYFTDCESIITFKNLIDEIGFAIIMKNNPKLTSAILDQPDVPDSINITEFINYIQPINVRGLV